MRSGQTMYMPAPNGMTEDAAQAGAYIRRLFAAERVDARLRAIATIDSGAGVAGDGHPAVLWTGGPASAEFGTLNVIVSPSVDRRDIGPAGFGTAGWPLPTLVAETLTPRLFRFKAERLNIGKCASGKNKTLSPDASNLPEVLFNLHANPDQFEEYESLVRRVFPLVETITVRPFDGTQVEIRVWQLPRESRRDDLAFPLDQCGTGIGQVMAILYVVVSSADPQIILIDEPNSFLHPGAARALVQVLRKFSKHQYIIATHAPEVIAEAAACPVIRVDWANGASKCTVFPERTTEVSRQLLADVGARLSDVFGFDQVLWVEGPSDALSFQALLIALGRPQQRLGVLPVRDTGSFKRRKIAEILDLYRRLSMADALVPPAVLFLFDRDGRNEREIQDAVRESEGMVRFLPRRQYENYLLNPNAIARLYNEAGSEFEISTTAADVEHWLTANGSRYVSTKSPPGPLSDAWREAVDGATLLEDLFVGLSNCRLKYTKTTHTPRLTVLVNEIDPEAGKAILQLIVDVID